MLFTVLGGGALLVYSGLTGVTLSEAILGKGGSLDPKGGKINEQGFSDPLNATVDTGMKQLLEVTGNSPKQIIDSIVIPMANANGVRRTVAQNDSANASHGATVSGGRSDHQGPPAERWAADMSNGNRPTPQMDKLAKALAERFNLKWSGSGAVSGTSNGYRYQLIYRSMVGGNHYNHVHFGVAKSG